MEEVAVILAANKTLSCWRLSFEMRLDSAVRYRTAGTTELMPHIWDGRRHIKHEAIRVLKRISLLIRSSGHNTHKTENYT